MNFKKNKILFLIILIIIILEITSVVYTIYFYNDLKIMEIINYIKILFMIIIKV